MNQKSIKYKSDFLLPKNNFLVGIGSVSNIVGNYFDYQYSKSVVEADMRALMSDWINTGNDIKMATEHFEKSIKEPSTK